MVEKLLFIRSIVEILLLAFPETRLFLGKQDIIDSPEIKKRGDFAWRTLPVYTIPSKRPLYSLVYINVPKPAWSNPPLVVP